MKLLGFTIGRSKAIDGEYMAKAAVSAGSITNWGSALVGMGSGGWNTLCGFVRESFAGAWQRNIVDSRECVLAFSAVFACITRIANDVAKLPMRLVEQGNDEIWTLVSPLSPYWKVLRKPNRWQNRIQFFTYWILSKLITGNTYVLKQREAGRPAIVEALYILDPQRVQVLVTSDGGVYYQLANDDLSGLPGQVTVPASEIIHDRMNTLFHPLVGVSPLFACGLAATQGNRIQANSSKFFENMSFPSGMLLVPTPITDDKAKKFKEEWERNFAGGNIGRVAVLSGGMKYEPMSTPPVEAQMIEQLRWTAEDVARAFGMPLYKIGAGPVPSNNNVEALNQQYHSDCLQIHLESIELCLDEGLGLTEVPAKTYGVEFDLDVLLRMDSATQMDTLVKGTGAGIVKIDEARAKLNRKPIPGGDAAYLQQQNFSLTALAKRDAQDDPFKTNSEPSALPPPANDDDADEATAAEARAFLEGIQKGLEHATV